jgi:hypothetical protein
MHLQATSGLYWVNVSELLRAESAFTGIEIDASACSYLPPPLRVDSALQDNILFVRYDRCKEGLKPCLIPAGAFAHITLY